MSAPVPFIVRSAREDVGERRNGSLDHSVTGWSNSSPLNVLPR